ncbi:winged helix-turn-helix domain-containing protein [Microbacterium soli]|uniref:Winged helix-turn-helix domain-containing protein n=1 Tax=Microbacterium soli TaxID=446075 RepID=A0ABP7MU09_9MICO
MKIGSSASLSAGEARRIALAAQGFSRRMPEAVAVRHLHRTMDRLGVLQIDSVNVFARSHYMPMFSRLGSYDPALLDRAFLSGTRHYVEYLAHEAAFMPVEDWALWGFRMSAWRRRASEPGSWMHANARTLDWVRAQLRERGTLRPSDLRDDAPRERGPWWDWDAAKSALEHLWRCGEVAIAGRAGFERRYDLAERIIPRTVLSQSVSVPDAVRELVRRAARSHGVATIADLNDYYRLRDRSAVRAAVADLVDSGELTPVVVRGWERSGRSIPAWLHRDAVLPRRIERTALLTPFDPVVWFRDRALRAFGLDYRIEIYVPAHKRRYGYYSLPVLVGDRIVARADLKADRPASVLRVQSIWWEPTARPEPDAAQVAGALARAASWQGLERISVSGWGDATDAVARALGGRDVAVERHVHPRERRSTVTRE